MKILKNKHNQSPALNRFVMKLTPIAAGCAVLLSTAAGSAYSQEAQATKQEAAPASDTIVVTGIRKGIEAAIAVKQNNNSIVEAISAEDIGKLPDTTIAESLARLPGVTTQRDGQGNATNISIRGLGPDFNGYLLNGREQTGTGDSRSADLSVYPAELIAGATVYKTTDASVMGAGLAGTIDQNLIDPLAFPGRVLSAKYEKSKTGVGLPVEGKGKRYSFAYIDQFADRKLGFAIGFVHSDSKASQFQSGNWGSEYPHGDWGDNCNNTQIQNGAAGVPGPTTTLTNTATGETVSCVGSGAGMHFTGASGPNWQVLQGRGYNYQTNTTTDKRDGVAAVLAYKPSKNFTSQLDIYYAKIDSYQKISQLQMPLLGQGDGASSFAGVFNANNQATSGVFSGVSLIDRNEAIFDQDKLKSFGWKNSLKMANGWTGTVDLSSNSATRVERDVEYYGGTLPSTLTATGLDGTARFTYGVSMTDPATMAVRSEDWSGIPGLAQAGYSKGPTVTDKVKGYRFDMKRDLAEGSLFSDIQFGLNYSDRTKDRVTNEGVLVASGANPYARVAFPSGASVQTNIGGSGIDMLTFDPQATFIPGISLTAKYNNDILSKTYGMEERITTAFAKLNIDTELWKMPLRGNVGMQLVNTDQLSYGFHSGASSTPTLVNPATAVTWDGISYNDVLPSLNLTSDLGSGQLLRFGLSKQLARPDLAQMRNTYSINPSGSLYSASSGNPRLQPFRATAIDLSFEKYFGKKGYVSAALFAKDLKTYIAPGIASLEFTDAILGSVGLTYDPSKPRTGTYLTTGNGEGGSLKGVEFAGSVPFEMLAPMLDGFGANGSYSYTTSSVNLPNLIGTNPDQAPSAGSIPLPGLSTKNAKLTLYFEKYGFSAFIADNYRSRYVGSVANNTTGGFPSLSYIGAQSWVSAQVGYEIQSGMFKNLGFRIEGNNLNKPDYVLTGQSSTSTTKTGKTIIMSLNYKLQ